MFLDLFFLNFREKLEEHTLETLSLAPARNFEIDLYFLEISREFKRMQAKIYTQKNF